MGYWVLCIVVFILGFVITEAYFRFKHKKIVVVRIKRKDGSEELIKIRPGRDPEADLIINKLKQRRGLQ